MIKIYKTDDGYILATKQNAIACSTFQKLVQVMKALDIPAEEIEYGLSELEINEHNIAEYGINKAFLYSRKIA